MIIAKPYLNFQHPGSPPSAFLGALPGRGAFPGGQPAPRFRRARRAGEPHCCEDCVCGSACPGCPDPGVYNAGGFRGPLDVFESPLWTHRKWLVLGGVALIGLSLLAGGAALLR